MAAISGTTMAALKAVADSQKPESPVLRSTRLSYQWKRWTAGRVSVAGPAAAAPDRISEKVVESIKNAEETCSDDPESGECAAAWDEVEELSAAASHARDRLKDADPLEEFCKDNPETEECRTYED
ncbi:calvin cycle protein CP12-1, chloroplastic-like [Cucurbita maxima]|uniref:Calvin cycle protein CP12-1, chloroplastic-like n=1 Tax=Cucurbita maxima TaxID=3661 RepID=A0A6J1KVB2_CUCMA|nr:calvin cycle protein CP12-1, chloroplastic-like [Cucurbita maxima]